MGVYIQAKNSKRGFHMAYSSFNTLRIFIARAMDQEFGDNYAHLRDCYHPDDFAEQEQQADIIIKRNDLTKYQDIIDFLYLSDCDGKVSYKVCKRIYDLIKDIPFAESNIQYEVFLTEDEYTDFKKFLQDCYSHRRSMVWY